MLWVSAQETCSATDGGLQRGTHCPVGSGQAGHRALASLICFESGVDLRKDFQAREESLGHYLKFTDGFLGSCVILRILLPYL